jgi:RNA polymerase sigma factor (sigma-70 family)
MATSTSDFETLLERLRTGDEEAAWQLVCEYGPHVVAVVRRRLRRQIRARLDSQDLVQAVWKSFFLDMPGIADLRSPEQLIKLLVELTQNKVVDAYRHHLYAERRRAAQEEAALHEENPECERWPAENGVEIIGRDATPSQFAMAREHWQRMLHERPVVHQEVIRRRLMGQTYESIAATLGISERTARRVIGDLWQEQCHDQT